MFAIAIGNCSKLLKGTPLKRIRYITELLSNVPLYRLELSPAFSLVDSIHGIREQYILRIFKNIATEQQL